MKEEKTVTIVVYTFGRFVFLLLGYVTIPCALALFKIISWDSAVTGMMFMLTSLLCIIVMGDKLRIER